MPSRDFYIVVVFFLIIGLFAWYWAVIDWLAARHHRLSMQHNHILHLCIGGWSILSMLSLVFGVMNVSTFTLIVLALVTGTLYYASGLWDEWWIMVSPRKQRFMVLLSQLSRIDILHHNVETAYPIFEILLGGFFLSGSLVTPLSLIFNHVPHYGELISILCFFLLAFLLFIYAFVMIKNGMRNRD
jgi:hypothetical protein